MILEARDISFSYERKGAELFSNINFKVENNERVWVPGPKDRFCWMESLCRRKGIVRCR